MGVRAALGLAASGITSVAAVRQAKLLIRPGGELAEPKAIVERLLAERVYRHPQVVASRRRVQDVLRALFARYVEQPDRMPATFQRRAANLGVQRAVGDYLAGMTDRYARQQFERLGL